MISSVPPNVEFQIDDVEDEWTYTQPFDYIHSRMMTSAIANWKKYIERCFKYGFLLPLILEIYTRSVSKKPSSPLCSASGLKPGGYLELQEGALYPKSDDGSLKTDSAMWRAIQKLDAATTKFGRPFQPIDELKPMMEAAGFVDVVESRFVWPSNTWPRDRQLKELGVWNHESMTSGLSGFFMAPMTRALNWSPEQVEVEMAAVRKDFADKSIHAYWPM